MATKLESLSTKLQSALDLANSLPDAITLDELTNPGSAATMLEGTEMLDAQGKKVTGTIESKDSSDLTASGATVNVPAGYYPSQATKSVATATRAETTITTTANDTADTLTFTASNDQGTGYVTGSNKTATKTVTLTASGATVTASDGSKSVSKSVATATQATPTINVNTSTGQITASATQSAGYVSAGTKSATPVNLTTKAAATITPTKSTQTAVAKNVYTIGAVTVDAIPDKYIDTSDADATAPHILAGETAYVDGVKVTGTMPQRVADEEASVRIEGDPSGAYMYVDLPEGHYNNQSFYYEGSTLAVTPTKATQTKADALYGKVTINPIPDKYQDVSGVTATAAGTLSGQKFVNTSGTLTTGTMPNNGSMSKTIDGLNTKSVSIPKGYTTGGTVSLDSTIDTTANAQAAQIAEIKAMLEGKSVSGGSGGAVETCTVTIDTSAFTNGNYVQRIRFSQYADGKIKYYESPNYGDIVASSSQHTLTNVACNTLLCIQYRFGVYNAEYTKVLENITDGPFSSNNNTEFTYITPSTHGLSAVISFNKAPTDDREPV